jgi:hypothetical protein
MNWKAKSAAICLAPALRRAVLLALEKDDAPAFEDAPYDDRQAWVELSQDVVATVIKLISPVAPQDDSLFQATAELTRRHFAAIKGGKS